MIGALAILAAYLIGSIPFGLLIARWFGKVDIRTVGSGNIGATNVGRTLGFKFFLLVFTLDNLKGFLPTWGLPRLFSQAGYDIGPDATVLVGLATILGHNFPIFLKFKGGKGVATSLGALMALDPVPSVAMFFGFLVFLLMTRMVSASSLLAGIVFVYAHFDRTPDPWSPSNRALSAVTLLLLLLVVVRHRKNIQRIIKGEEPKVSFRKKRASGKAAVWLVLGCVAVAAVAVVLAQASREPVLMLDGAEVREVARASTGYQRSERLAFSPDETKLFVTCPRYARVLILDPATRPELKKLGEITLEGRPLAIATSNDRLYVLQRPKNDQRHVQPGWLDIYDHDGKSIASRITLGYYPDDLALTGDGIHALVILSGSAEGGKHRPKPSLVVIETATGKQVGRCEFESPSDDPVRIAYDQRTSRVAVSLQGSEAVGLIDVSRLDSPRMVARRAMGKGHGPEAVRFDADGAVLISDVATSELGVWTPEKDGYEAIPMPDGLSDLLPLGAEPGRLVYALPHGSGIEFPDTSGHGGGRLTIRGRTPLSATRPIGLAEAPRHGWIAVANRAGGSIHLIELPRHRAPTLISSTGVDSR